MSRVGRMPIDKPSSVTVKIEPTRIEVKGPKVVFDVEIHDALDQVGKSRHIRFMIDKGGQQGRLEKKRAKAKEAGAL